MGVGAAYRGLELRVRKAGPGRGRGLDWEGLLRLLASQGGFLRLLCFVVVFFELGHSGWGIESRVLDERAV